MDNALSYLQRQVGSAVPDSYAIERDGEAVGSISAHRQEDVNRLSVEIGYWLGEEHWGAGIMTEVVADFTKALLLGSVLPGPAPVRVFAGPFATNRSSIRLLEKAGFHFEGRLLKSVVKGGVVLDQLMHSKCAMDR